MFSLKLIRSGRAYVDANVSVIPTFGLGTSWGCEKRLCARQKY